MGFITLTLIVIAIFIVEGFTDAHIDLSAIKKNSYHNKQWHKANLIYTIIWVSTMSYILEGFSWDAVFLAFYMGVIRVTFFEPTRNIVFNGWSNIFYVGRFGDWDIRIRKYFTPKQYFIAKVILFLITMIVYYFISLRGNSPCISSEDTVIYYISLLFNK